MTGIGLARHARTWATITAALAIGVFILVGTSGAADSVAGAQDHPYFPLDPTVDQRAQESAEEAEHERDTPAARERRLRSRTAHKGLSPEEAIFLARTEHRALAARALGRALGLEGEQRVVRFLSETAALVDMGGHRSVAVSTGPIAVQDGSDLVAVDLDLMPVDSGFVAEQPAVDVRVPAAAGQRAAVGGNGLGMVPLVGARAVEPHLVDGRVFWPSTAADTDVLAMPTPHGLEVAYFLRSPEAPEDLTLGLSLPEGAGAQRGLEAAEGVRIAKDGRALARISAPVAVDAGGLSLPVKYAIRDGDLAIHVDHRGLDVEYPIAIDPVMEQDWQTSADAFTGWNFHVVNQQNGSLPWRSSQGDAGAGRGLNIWRDAGTNYPGERADWYRGVPGNSYVDVINVRSIQWWLANSCIWIGVNRSNGGTWPWEATYEHCQRTSGGNTVNNGFFYGVGPMNTATKTEDTYNVVLANHIRSDWWPNAEWHGFHMTHWGNVEIFYADRLNPSASPPTANSSWLNPNRTGGNIVGTASDAGVGLAKHGLDASWNNVEYDFGGSNNCTGDWNSICPGTDTQTQSLTAAPDGLHTISTRAEDLLGKTAVSSPITLRIDRRNPSATLSGATIDSTDEHIAVGAGRHAVTVNGIDPPSTGVVNASGARSTTLAVGATPPTREARYTTTSGCSANCTVNGTYTFDAGPTPSPFGLGSFTDVPGKTLQTHTPESGGPWVRHASSSLDAVITSTGRVRRNGSGNGLLSLTGTHPNADYDVSADVVAPQPTATRQGDVGIVGRLNTTTGEGYVAAYSQAAQQWQLHRRGSDGLLQQIGWASANVTAGVAYRLVLRLRGSSLSMFVNGSLVIAATDGTLTGAGRAGVYFYGPQGGAALPSDTATPQLDTFTASGAGRTEGPHDFTLDTTDGASNSATDTYRVVVDRTAPTQDPAFGTLAEVRAVDDGLHDIGVTARDSGVWPNIAGMGRFELSVDGQVKDVAIPEEPAQEATGQMTLDATAAGGLVDGRHQAEVRAYDDAIRQPAGLGNPSSNPQTFSFIVDRNPPVLTVPSGTLKTANGTSVPHGQYTLNISVTDATAGTPRAGMGTIEVFVDGDSDFLAEQSCLDGDCGQTANYTFDTTQHRGGWHDIEVVATDLAGNEDVETFRVATPCCMQASAVWDTLLADDIRFGDVDGDGTFDLVSRDGTTGDVTVRLSDGADFGPAQRWGSVGVLGTLEAFEVGDVNGDLRGDVVFVQPGADPNRRDLRVMISQGNQFASAATWGSWPARHDLQLRDLSGEGQDDVVGRHADTGAVRAAYANTTSFMNDRAWGTSTPSYPVRYADVDGDESADMISVSDTDRLLVGLSQGNQFAAAADWGGVTVGSDVAFGDVDSDGIEDAIVRSRQNGDAVFLPSTETAFGTSVALGRWDPAISLEAHDISGDGHVDLAGVEGSALTARNARVGITTAQMPSAPQIDVVEDDPLEDDTDLFAEDDPGGSVQSATTSDVTARAAASSYAPPPLAAQQDPQLIWRESLRDANGTIDAARAFSSACSAQYPCDATMKQRAEAQIDILLNRLRQTGVETIRVNLWWGMVQTAPGSAMRYDFRRFRESIVYLRDKGFKVMVTLSGVANASSGLEFGRCYLNVTGSLGCSAGGTHNATGSFPPPDTGGSTARRDAIDEWGDFVEAAVSEFASIPARRNSAGRILNRRYVRVYGLWNEPNYTGRTKFLHVEGQDLQHPGDTTELYRAIYDEGRRRAKAGSDDAKTLFGGLSAAQSRYWRPSGTPGEYERLNDVSPVAWMERVADAMSGKINVDGVAYHPYQHYVRPWAKSPSRSYGIGRLAEVRAALKRMAATKLGTLSGNTARLYLTEFGYLNALSPAPMRPPPTNATEAAQQAQYRRIRRNTWHTEAQRERWFFGGRGSSEYGALEQARRAGAKLLVLYAFVEAPPSNTSSAAVPGDPPDTASNDYGLMGGGHQRIGESNESYGSPFAEVVGDRRYGKRRGNNHHRNVNPRSAFCTIREWARDQPGSPYTTPGSPCAAIRGRLPKQDPPRG